MSEERLIAIRTNSASDAATTVLVVSIRCQAGPRGFDLVDGLEKPLAPFVSKHHFPYLLSGVNDKRIWDTNFYLVFNQSAMRKGLDHMVGVDSSTTDWNCALEENVPLSTIRPFNGELALEC